MARFLGPQVCGLFADDRVVEVYVNRDLVVRTDGALGRQETGLVLTEEAIWGFLNIAATREEISLAGEESCENGRRGTGRDAYPFLDSMATGHGGGMCTIHAGSRKGP